MVVLRVVSRYGRGDHPASGDRLATAIDLTAAWSHPDTLGQSVSVTRVLYVYCRQKTFTRIYRYALAERFQLEESIQPGADPLPP